MTPRRLLAGGTFLVVTGLLVWLMVMKWDRADKVIQVVEVVVAVVTLAVTVWALLPGAAAPRGARASRTGNAIARGNSRATSGIVTPAAKAAEPATADRTGEAVASDGGDATSGVRLE